MSLYDMFSDDRMSRAKRYANFWLKQRATVYTESGGPTICVDLLLEGLTNWPGDFLYALSNPNAHSVSDPEPSTYRRRKIKL